MNRGQKRPRTKTNGPTVVPGGRSLTTVTWSLYVVECADGSYYTGIAKDVEKRIQAHNDGRGAKYTATRGPVKLLFQEPQKDYSSALRREYQVKSLPKKKKVLFAQGKKLRKPSRKAKMSFQRKPSHKKLSPRKRRRQGGTKNRSRSTWTH